jgi:ABC-type nitrate/sulfonate/bicarbonate transport system substrate-binding protein
MDTKERAQEWRKLHDTLVADFLKAVREARDKTEAEPEAIAAAMLDAACTVRRTL